MTLKPIKHEYPKDNINMNSQVNIVFLDNCKVYKQFCLFIFKKKIWIIQLPVTLLERMQLLVADDSNRQIQDKSAVEMAVAA